MAKCIPSVLGQFSGRLGSIVYSSWKGIRYVKSLPRKTKKRDVSPKVEIQRAKFKLAASFVKAIASLVAITFPDSRTKTTSRNSALSNVLQQAITGDYPDLRIEYSKVFMANGSLPPTVNPAATCTAPGVINFSWKDNTGYGKAKATDQPVLIAFCEGLNACSFIVSDALRSEQTASLPAKLFSGKQVHTWISFLSENGKNVAKSSYTGTVTVA
jgi:hypothetical protein